MPFVESVHVPNKPWGQETILAEGPGYQHKRLRYMAGHQGGFQYHPDRDEAFTLHEGGAEVTWMDDSGKHSSHMLPGMTFHVPPGTPHKFHAITDCVVYEVSNGKPPASVNVAKELDDEDGQAR
jgi:mannose-6-phosphate isomerase-like protein (cupin superfamily)